MCSFKEFKDDFLYALSVLLLLGLLALLMALMTGCTKNVSRDRSGHARCLAKTGEVLFDGQFDWFYLQGGGVVLYTPDGKRSTVIGDCVVTQ